MTAEKIQEIAAIERQFSIINAIRTLTHPLDFRDFLAYYLQTHMPMLRKAAPRTIVFYNDDAGIGALVEAHDQGLDLGLPFRILTFTVVPLAHHARALTLNLEDSRMEADLLHENLVVRIFNTAADINISS